jgi:hypothetical protein
VGHIVGNDLAQNLMDEFADATGVSGKIRPRRYLWTDAFAVCNFLGLYRRTGDGRYLQFARELVEQVHHLLGCHRDDDPRRGWISGLPAHEGEEHPTRGGLRIGKTLNERKSHEPPNSQLEWDQDGQYFHYLTKWMHALNRMSRETGESRYHRWAVELAVTAYKAFTREVLPGGPKQIVWKMSIDLSWPLVSSMGQHDPLDGLITFLELQATANVDSELRDGLGVAIADMTEMCRQARWATEDPLGIGGLLDDATRLARLIFEYKVGQRELLHQLLAEAERSFQVFGRSNLLRRSAEQRLPFRELGLSIGIHGTQRLKAFVARDHELAANSDDLLQYRPLAQQIDAFWSDPTHRLISTWMEHRDINSVMLSTSLAPEGYLQM